MPVSHPILCALALGLLAVPATPEEPMVAVYFNPVRGGSWQYETGGAEGIQAALEENGFEDRMKTVKDFSPESLKGIDVLIVSCVQNYPPPLEPKAVREAQRKFAEEGHGVVLVHESIGWRRALWEDPPFPEIGKGHGGPKVGPYTLTPVQVVKKDHPIAKGLPAEFPIAYDIAQMELGEQGEMVLKVSEKATVRGNPVTATNVPALVAGKFGKGRVVLIGPLVGMDGKNLEKPPTGGELRMFLNAIRWAAGKE